MKLDARAVDRPFKPPGIARAEWIAGAYGTPSTASGLRPTLPDLAKIDRMEAQGGVWEGRRIVPADWLEASFRPRAAISEIVRYGYLRHLSGKGDHVIAFAAGNGGQRLTVEPDAGLVAASFAGRCNDPEGWRPPPAAPPDFAVPEARRQMAR